jgi:hypothetical protein
MTTLSPSTAVFTAVCTLVREQFAAAIVAAWELFATPNAVPNTSISKGVLNAEFMGFSSL